MILTLTPPSSLLDILISPPCAEMICWQIVKPEPVLSESCFDHHDNDDQILFQIHLTLSLG